MPDSIHLIEHNNSLVQIIKRHYKGAEAHDELNSSLVDSIIHGTKNDTYLTEDVVFEIQNICDKLPDNREELSERDLQTIKTLEKVLTQDNPVIRHFFNVMTNVVSKVLKLNYSDVASEFSTPFKGNTKPNLFDYMHNATDLIVQKIKNTTVSKQAFSTLSDLMGDGDLIFVTDTKWTIRSTNEKADQYLNEGDNLVDQQLSVFLDDFEGIAKEFEREGKLLGLNSFLIDKRSKSDVKPIPVVVSGLKVEQKNRDVEEILIKVSFPLPFSFKTQHKESSMLIDELLLSTSDVGSFEAKEINDKLWRLKQLLEGDLGAYSVSKTASQNKIDFNSLEKLFFSPRKNTHIEFQNGFQGVFIADPSDLVQITGKVLSLITEHHFSSNSPQEVIVRTENGTNGSLDLVIISSMEDLALDTTDLFAEIDRISTENVGGLISQYKGSINSTLTREGHVLININLQNK